MADPSLPAPPQLPGRSPTKPARSARRRGLTTNAIVAAAMAIVETEGLDALTMRAVASALGTGAASLYAYVGSKDDLVDLLIDRVIGEIRFEDEPDPARWREQFKQMAVATREAWGRHGDLARASFGRIPVGENALAGSERIAALLRAGGLSDRVVGLALDQIGLYIGAIAYEDSFERGAVTSMEELAEFSEQLRIYFAALPVSRFPNLVSLADEVTAPVDRFAFGLDVLLAGLEAVHAQDSPST